MLPFKVGRKKKKETRPTNRCVGTGGAWFSPLVLLSLSTLVTMMNIRPTTSSSAFFAVVGQKRSGQRGRLQRTLSTTCSSFLPSSHAGRITSTPSCGAASLKVMQRRPITVAKAAQTTRRNFAASVVDLSRQYGVATAVGGSDRLFSSSSSAETTENETIPYPPLLQQPFIPSDYQLYPPHNCPSTADSTLGIIPVEQLQPKQRIVSFGDVHGDLPALIQFLTTAGVMARPSSLDDAITNPTWVGGTTIVVQIGDILDRGGSELACLRLLSALSKQAVEQGGAIHVLYGNHESLNICGMFQYAFPEGNAEFELRVGQTIDQNHNSNRWRLQYGGNQPCRWTSFEPGRGLLAEPLVKQLKVVMVVGRTVFVHAGLTKEHVTEMGGIVQMNLDARRWAVNLQHEESNDEGQYETVDQVIQSATKRAKSISSTIPACLGGGIGSPSPVWMRDYSQPADLPPKNVAATTKRVVDALDAVDDCVRTLVPDGTMHEGGGVKRMVMGHTPQSQINVACGGRAWRVDVGASRGVNGGTPEVLEIIHGGANEGEEDEISILTAGGRRIPASDRYLFEDADVLFN